MQAVDAAREYAQSLAEVNGTTQWDVLDITSRISGALTITYHCDHCQNFPLSGCTWYVCTGICKRVKNRGSSWFLWQVRTRQRLERRQ